MRTASGISVIIQFLAACIRDAALAEAATSCLAAVATDNLENQVSVAGGYIA